jgi:hypothetical protein
MAFYPSLTRVIALTTIRRERILPVQGEVLAKIDTRVEPMTIVARAKVPGRYRILDVAQTLRVFPDEAEKYVERQPGQAVKAGETVAQRHVALGLFPRVVRAPQAGVVAAVGGGRVLLETVGQPVELRAYLRGTVANVIPNVGVLIETVGSLIQAVWGSGGESFGVLKALVDEPNQPLRAASIDVGCHGAVLVGGSTLDRDALQQALDLQVRGIIVGSLDPGSVELAQSMPFPVIVTEGFGQAPMAQPIFQLLRTSDGREASLSGRTQSRWEKIRPEVVIPLPVNSAPSPPPRAMSIQVGVRVRVTRGPMTGAVGTVRHVPTQPPALDTGARVGGAVVAFEGAREQFVPFFNLELLV